MKIKSKLILGSALLVLIPGLIVGISVATSALNSSSEALKYTVSQQLISVRDSTEASIVDYFNFINGQVLTLSENPATVDAMEGLISSYQTFKKQTNDDSSAESLLPYYNEQFNKKYAEINNGHKAETSKLLDLLDENAIALQSAYISNNPYPLGEKDKLKATQDDSNYSLLHSQIHPHFSQYLNQFGYYDIFLVDSKTGNIVYSVYKELDFATSLKTGPYANSGLAEAFNAMTNQSSSSVSMLTDFKHYLPSYESPAAFIASPIFKDGEQIGVLIFQMPIERINNIMTHNAKWESAGLGKSGETYLVGQDRTLRSESRFLIEDNLGYLSMMKEVGIPLSTYTELVNKGTGIAIQPVDTVGTKAALSGDEGFMIFDDYRGISVLSAYSSISLLGQQWALMSEIDEEEAFAPIAEIRSTIFFLVLGIVVVLALFAIGIGYSFALIIIKPINNTVEMVRDIAEGEGDLTQRLEDNKKDELDEMSAWFNRFLDDLQKIITEFKSKSLALASASTELSHTAEETGSNMQTQLSATTEVSAAVTEMTATVQSVSDSTQETASIANLALEDVSQGNRVIVSSVSSMNTLATEVEEAANVINQLQQNAQEIGSVLDVIKGIAEQTNLLALNAAIEAARAGEQGRGFAVVADEVRTLASRTQESTEEINNMIMALRKGTEQAVEVMSKSQETAQNGVAQSSEASAIFTTISNRVNNISSMMEDIASATEQQSVTSEEINRNIHSINDGVTSVAASSIESVQASNELANIANHLDELIGRFKV